MNQYVPSGDFNSKISCSREARAEVERKAIVSTRYDSGSIVVDEQSFPTVNWVFHFTSSPTFPPHGGDLSYILQSIQISDPDMEYAYDGLNVSHLPSGVDRVFGTIYFLPLPVENLNWIELYSSTIPAYNRKIYEWNTSDLIGDYLLKIYAEDKAGNVKIDESVIRLNNSKPIAEITKPLNYSIAKGTISVNGTAKGDFFSKYELYYCRESDNNWVKFKEVYSIVEKRQNISAISTIHKIRTK